MAKRKSGCEGCGYRQKSGGTKMCIYALVNGVSRHARFGEWPKPGRCRFFTGIPQRIPREDLPIRRRIGYDK